MGEGLSSHFRVRHFKFCYCKQCLGATFCVCLALHFSGKPGVSRVGLEASHGIFRWSKRGNLACLCFLNCLGCKSLIQPDISVGSSHSMFALVISILTHTGRLGLSKWSCGVEEEGCRRQIESKRDLYLFVVLNLKGKKESQRSLIAKYKCLRQRGWTR